MISRFLAVLLLVLGTADLAAQSRFASVLEDAGRPDSVLLIIPDDPCDALYSRLDARIRDADLNFGPVALDQEAFFKHFCEQKKDELIAKVRAPFDDARAQAEDAVNSAIEELTAGFWKFVAEQLYDLLPPAEQARFQPGSPEMDELAHAWLNSAPDEVAAYAIAYLSAGEATSYLVRAWEIYADLTSGESKEIIDEFSGILELAKQRLGQLTAANQAVKEAVPDTPYADVLEKVGLSGAWIDRFKAHEGELRALNKSYRIGEALTIVTEAIQTTDPTDKVDAFVELVRIAGNVSKNSRLPLVSLAGEYVEELASTAQQMLEELDTLEQQLAERNGFCLGTGVPSSDPRTDYFVARGVLACPMAYGTWPFQHIYVSQGAGPARWYFFDGESFIESENPSGREGILAALGLIDAASGLGYDLVRDPAGHVAMLGSVYDTAYPGGVPALLADSQDMVAGIGEALQVASDATVAGDSCSADLILDEIADQSGLSLQSLTRDLTEGPEQLALAIAASFIALEGGFGPAVSHTGAGYETYRRLSEALRTTTILILEGTVLDDSREPVPGAILSFEVSGGREVRGCETWRADQAGRFVVTAVGTGSSMALTGQAETADVQGPSRTFDRAYFEDNAIARTLRGEAETVRAEGELTLPAEGPAEPVMDCTALGAEAYLGKRALSQGDFDGLPRRVESLDAAIGQALEFGTCPAADLEQAVATGNRIAWALDRVRQVDDALEFCDGDRMTRLRETLPEAQDVDFSMHIGALDAALAFRAESLNGMALFQAGDIGLARSILDEQNESLITNDYLFRASAGICPVQFSWNEDVIGRILVMQETAAAVDAAVAACRIPELEALDARIQGDTNPFYGGVRDRLADGLAGCIADTGSEQDRAYCAAAQAELDAARESYRANDLKDARARLRKLGRRVVGELPEACADIEARVRKGLDNIAVLMAEEERLQEALARCDIASLEAQKARSLDRDHLFFATVVERVDEGLRRCSDQPETVCRRLDAALDIVGSPDVALVDGLVVGEGTLAQIDGPASVAGCESAAAQLRNRVARVKAAIDVLGRVDQAIADCDPGTIGLVNTIDEIGLSHPQLTAAATRLRESMGACDDEPIADDPPPQVTEPAPPVETPPELDVTGNWQGDGAIEVIQESIGTITRFTVTESGVTGTFRLETSERTIDVVGSFDGEVLHLEGETVQQGATLSVVQRARVTDAGTFEGETVFNTIDIACAAEALFTDSSGDHCGYIDYLGTWRASRR